MLSDRDISKYRNLIEKLSLIDNPEDWFRHIKLSEIQIEDKKHIYESAMNLWIKRKIYDGSLLLHPDIREELIDRDFKPLSIHKKMIWASLLASYDGHDSSEYFQRIKQKLIKKYGVEWWLDVLDRIKPTRAAKQRLMKQNNSIGPAFKHAASQSMFLGNVLSESKDDALRMIPKE
jgi:hypothetical protein